MKTAERIYAEVKRLPENIAVEVLDFILFLAQRHVLDQTEKKAGVGQWDTLSLDTRNWRFDREKANAR